MDNFGEYDFYKRAMKDCDHITYMGYDKHFGSYCRCIKCGLTDKYYHSLDYRNANVKDVISVTNKVYSNIVSINLLHRKLVSQEYLSDTEALHYYNNALRFTNGNTVSKKVIPIMSNLINQNTIEQPKILQKTKA